MSDISETGQPTPASPALESGTYEIIRERLEGRGRELEERLGKLNTARRDVFGSIGFALQATERITTEHNCVPRDMVAIGKNRFLFGYNVFIGLKSQTDIADVFAVYEKRAHEFQPVSLEVLGDEAFQTDFNSLYKYYRHTFFAKFSIIGPHLFMVFRVGREVTDIKTFKWLMTEDGLVYQGNRSDHEFRFPPQHEFEWTRTHRDLHRQGLHPHISIEDRVFVETVGGDLTIKVEDNTSTGAGIYTEPVEHKDQTLDDAEVFYAGVGNLILLKIRPYQEAVFRYFVFNEKLQEVRRIDTIEDACVLLPNHQGIVFANGYYLQLGEWKQYPGVLAHMMFERRVASPNGEDHLFVFYNRLEGVYILMSYNIIEQKVEAPMVCNGFSLFANGELALFKTKNEPQKHHVIQIWQTPYLAGEIHLPEKKDALLFKIGNPAIVRCMAEAHELLSLLRKEDTYADLYIDLAKRADDIMDTYFWVGQEEAFDLRETLAAIKEAAAGAIDEFDKVSRLRRQATAALGQAGEKTQALVEAIHSAVFEDVVAYVEQLARLRAARGELIALKDLRYVDVARVDALEQQVAAESEALSHRCVEFLLEPEALAPYQAMVRNHEAAAGALAKVAEVKEAEAAVGETAGRLEMLIEIVSNLKIEDATRTTQIIESISAVYAELNGIQAGLRRRRQELQQVEGAAQFSAQMRLLDQSAANYLEVSDAPERCDEYLNKILVQVTELEGRFADFDEFQLQLAAKREELYTAFEGRKVALVEGRSRRTQTLMAAAERILKGIEHRVAQYDAISEIHGYFAGDLMVDRVRGIVRELLELNDSVKAGTLQSRLKTIREDAVRQLKDRQELFVDGRKILQFGRHKFAVNSQPLELTLVLRESEMCFHLTGTNFLEPVTDPEFLATRDVWAQEIVSETREVYRAEYLAFQILRALEAPAPDRPGADGDGDAGTGGERTPTMAEAAAWEADACVRYVQRFMAPRYAEGYVKGVHDVDAARLLTELVRMRLSVGLLRYASRVRACATVFWLIQREQDPVLAAQLDGWRLRNELFGGNGHGPAAAEPGRRRRRASAPGGDSTAQGVVVPAAAGSGNERYIGELQERVRAFNRRTGLFSEELAEEAGEYLFHDLTSGPVFVISQAAAELAKGFESHLRDRQQYAALTAILERAGPDPVGVFPVLRDWLGGFLPGSRLTAHEGYVDEAASLLLRQSLDLQAVVKAAVESRIEGMMGSHRVITEGCYRLRYHEFTAKLKRYERVVVPAFNRLHQRKTALLEQMRQELRLEEFQPRVMTAFVRNRLIDEVYLPLIGDNLAKQIGVAGEQTRTDRMGLLLVISPPGYGKTTLMEYIANRLGITFIKINGPALGTRVTSLDPAEAPNASAREEIEKLNLALEMGDNIMIYLDDIQHCHPELLQKFISLCDAQRKIEGVYRGRARTYDLRGRKVAVVMAGNPYTESGSKFQIPDMLANRADTYNLGDIVEGAAESFKASYLENALTSNPVLARLSGRSQSDLYALMRVAEGGTREGVTFEGNYSVEEINEFAAVLRILMRLRDAVLRVNQEYIRSAAQADAYRTEPPFRLQGSYRNMNRLAERVVPIMNEAEVARLIHDHYQNEAQTLAAGAEANLLKFRELMGTLRPEEAQRWEEIKQTFRRNLLLQSTDTTDPVGRVTAQLATFGAGLDAIRKVLEAGMAERDQQSAAPPEVFAQLATQLASLEGIRTTLAEGLARTAAAPLTAPAAESPLPQVVLEQLARFNAGLESVRTVLEANLKQAAQQPATFRLIDPSSKADFEITNVSQETLNKIWALVDQDRARR